MNNIWSQIKRNFEYLLKEVQDWAVFFKHFYSIFMEFDASYALSKALLGPEFHENFRPLLIIWTDEDGQELFTWDEFVKKL